MNHIKLKLLHVLKKLNLKSMAIFWKRYKRIKPYHKDALSQLKKLGFYSIKKYSINTWKYYGKDLVRFTYKARKDSTDYLVKCSKGFEEKAKNSIYFQERFNELFDFIPKGYSLQLNGFVGQAFFFVDSHPFYFFKYIVRKDNSAFFINQICNILDKLNEFKIVHCDINSVNVLIEKKTNKLFLIDFDTCISGLVGLHCHDIPRSKYSVVLENTVIYDDAKAFYELLNEINNQASAISPDDFAKVGKRIGRNTIEIDKKYCNYK